MVAQTMRNKQVYGVSLAHTFSLSGVGAANVTVLLEQSRPLGGMAEGVLVRVCQSGPGLEMLKIDLVKGFLSWAICFVGGSVRLPFQASFLP